MTTTQTLEAVRFFRTQYPHSDYMHWLKLARAEAWARESGLEFNWEDDWAVGSHVKEYPDAYDAEPDECEACVVLDADETIVASLHCIDDATDDYRRVVEAELAWEAMPTTIQPPLPFDVAS